MTVYRGPFAINCLTNKDVAWVLPAMTRAMDSLKIQYSRVSLVNLQPNQWFLKCNDPKSGTRFEMELCRMENLDSVFIVRMKKLEGEM